MVGLLSFYDLPSIAPPPPPDVSVSGPQTAAAAAAAGALALPPADRFFIPVKARGSASGGPSIQVRCSVRRGRRPTPLRCTEKGRLTSFVPPPLYTPRRSVGLRLLLGRRETGNWLSRGRVGEGTQSLRPLGRTLEFRLWRAKCDRSFSRLRLAYP